MTTETPTKKARKSKGKADVAPVDFKKLAEETRAKMAAKPAPAKAKRKRAVRQLHFQPGDFVSYRHGGGYLTALVREVREGGYALELPQDHPVNGRWQVEATVEEVTPRALKLSGAAPLVVGDRVARALFGPDLVPLSIEGDCVVQEVTADGEVLIRNEQGQQWQGTPDQRLTLCGRADLNTALRDLGRPVSGELDAPQEQAAPTLPDKASGKARSARNKVDMEPYPFASGDFVRLVDSRISALVQEQLLDGEYALLIPTEEEGTQRIIATAPAFEVFPRYVGVFEPGDRVRHLESARYGTVTAVAGERVTVSYRSGHVEELIGAAALDTAGISDLKRAAKPLGVVLPSEAATAGLDKVQAPAKASPVIEADTAYSAGQLVAVLGRRRQHGVISRILDKGCYAVLLEASGIDSLAYSESSLEPLILAPRFPLQVGDGVVLDQSGADWFPELAASAYLQVTFANGVQARVIRIEDDPESAEQHDVEPHYLKVVRRANLDHAAYDLGWKRSPAGSEANLMAESDTPASDTTLRDLGRPSVESSEEAAPPAPRLRFQVGDVVKYETAENGEKVERVALVRRELLDGQYGDYLVTVVDEHSLEVQRQDDEDWDVMVNESRMNIIYPSGEMDWKPEILALVPELGWTRAALKATNPALLPEPATEPAPNLPEPEEETDQVVISRAPLELPDTPVLLEIFSPTAPVDLEKLQALRTLPAEGGVIALSPALPEPGMLGTFDLPLDITEDSPFNVRHYREPEKVEALAASLKAEGQLQECAGRWTSAGRVEIFMGGTRRAAQLLRAAQGEKGLTLRVTIRQATDAQALRISTLENKSRNDLTPLEDCESVHLLLKAGETPESLRLMFGYKTAQPILDRQVIATNLHTVGRDLLEQGRLSLSQAAVIARASGADLQEQMIQQATRGGADSSAEALSRQLTRGQILVRDVPFDVDRSGLAVKQDAFDTYPAYFADKVKALNAVVQWANEQARREEVTGDRAFCHVVTGESSVWNPHVRGKYEGCTPDDDGAGRVYYVCTTSGKVTVEDGVRQIMKAAPTPAAPAPASAGRPVPATSTASHEAAPEQAAKRREFPETFFHHCHQLRADAARTAALQRPHAMLAMTVAGLIMGPDTSTERDKGGVSLTEISGAPGSSAHLRAPLPDALETRHQAMLEVLRPAARGNAPTQGVYVLGGPQRTPYDRAVLLNILLGLREDALMEFLLTLTAMAAYDWSGWSPRTQAAAHYQVFAREVEADTLLAQNFTLTDQHLKYYPRHELVALAEEAGLGRALVEDCKTTKQMRGRILEHADHLRRKGFVPRHVRFEEAKK